MESQQMFDYSMQADSSSNIITVDGSGIVKYNNKDGSVIIDGPLYVTGPIYASGPIYAESVVGEQESSTIQSVENSFAKMRKDF